MGDFLATPFLLIASACLYVAGFITGKPYQLLEGVVLVIDEETGKLTLYIDEDDYDE